VTIIPDRRTVRPSGAAHPRISARVRKDGPLPRISDNRCGGPQCHSIKSPKMTTFLRARNRVICARTEWRPAHAAGPTAVLHRDLVIALAARHRLPAVYQARFFSVAAGGLMSSTFD
jgi:hypothetical protein